MKNHLLLLIFLILSSAQAATWLAPSNIVLETPSGSNNTGSVYTDDSYLSSITFNGNVFNRTAEQTQSVISAYIYATGQENVNPEWGDNDTGSDGDPDPLTRVGLNPVQDQESPDKAIKEKGLVSAFSGYSLIEGSDGEPGTSTINIMFSKGITDNDSSILDTVPEIILFERGNNDNTTLRLITGGTYDNPTLSDPVTISSGELHNTGININTIEISNSQELAAGGLDLNEFFSGTPLTAYGLQIQTDGGDFYGQFASALTIDQYRPQLPALLNPNAVIPETHSVFLAMIAMGTIFIFRRKSRK